MPPRMRLSSALLALAVALPTGGCVTDREKEHAVKPEIAVAYLADKPAPLRRAFYVSLAQGPRNRVLNDMRLGLASIELGNAPLAEQLFDEALGYIEAVYGATPEADKARSLFTKEAVKDFKGEPYERVMAYYYRGLLYLKAGDYDNARASFRGGFLQDAFAEEQQNQADFGLMPYLAGWASKCRGNDLLARDDFAEFAEIKSDVPLPANQDDTLLLVETGSAPIKYSQLADSGNRKQYLKYRRASATETPRLSLLGAKSQGPTPQLVEDIYFQASTRGGREFDAILGDKVVFHQTTGTVGDVALQGAVVAAGVAANSRDKETQRDAAIAAGSMAAVGLIAKALQATIEPEPDTRYWDNLPDRVYAATLRLPAGISQVSVDFFDQSGTMLRNRIADIWQAGGCRLAWVRSESAVPGNPRAPGSAPRDEMYDPIVLPALPAAPEPVTRPGTQDLDATSCGEKNGC